MKHAWVAKAKPPELSAPKGSSRASKWLGRAKHSGATGWSNRSVGGSGRKSPPRKGGENFQQFINDLSLQLGATVAVMQMDRAPAHRAARLEWSENIIPIFQPAHCPKLNPIERLWQFLKQQWKTENFASIDELRSRVTQELEPLSEQQVQTLTSFDFILDALLQVAF